MSVGLRVRVKGGKLDINLAIIIKAALAGGALLSAFNVSLGYLAGGVNGAVSALALNLAHVLACAFSFMPFIGVVLQSIAAYWHRGTLRT